jgi:hypothetical protein
MFGKARQKAKEAADLAAAKAKEVDERYKVSEKASAGPSSPAHDAIPSLPVKLSCTRGVSSMSCVSRWAGGVGPCQS